MINGYIKNKFGIIEQIDKTKSINYNIDYITNRYVSYKNLTNYMSYLRLGFILGTVNTKINSILDVGYGNGSFLSTCKHIIPNCYGNDISGFHIPKDCIFVEDITKEHYDIITFFDSLEHFSDLSIIKKIKCKYVCISVPWCHYESDEWFMSWKHRRPNEHFFHFNLESLQRFFMSCGFELVKHCNIEDTIRKSDQTEPNILTASFKKT